MSSWEDIANEVVPLDAPPPAGLATAARRGTGGRRGNLGAAFGVERYLRCPDVPEHGAPEVVWCGRPAENYSGSYYHIDRTILDYDERGGDMGLRLASALKSPPSRQLAGLDAEDLVFFDIETLGLSSHEPLFLIGTMAFAGGDATIQLLLARSPAEEAAVITAFSHAIRGKTLVSFNGKGFDLPYVEGRAQRLGVPLTSPAGHFDLLFAARRRWRSTFPNCRLQTLEMGVCGRGREGDIPSSHIPARYREFLAASRHEPRGSHLLAPILFHNALDVLTLGKLLCHLSVGVNP